MSEIQLGEIIHNGLRTELFEDLLYKLEVKRVDLIGILRLLIGEH